MTTEATSPEVQEPVTGAEEKPRKKRTTKGMRRNVQELDVGMSKAMRHMARGFADGMDEYVRRRKISAGNKRDGALKDFDKNVMRAFRKSVGPMTKAPSDLARAAFRMRLNPRMRKTFRRNMRSMARFMGV